MRFLLIFILFSGTLIAEDQTYRHAAVAGGNYLLASQNEDGRFVYERDPSQPPVTRYNWLRHAGTMYALCQLYSATGQTPYRDAAARAAAPMLEQLQRLTIRGQEVLVLVSDPDKGADALDGEPIVKTGGVALAMIALMYVDAAHGTTKHTDTVRELRHYLHMIVDQSGGIQSKYLVQSKRFSVWKSDYYPGQVLMALAMAQTLAPSAVTRRAVIRLTGARAAGWFAASKTAPETRRVFDHWGLIGVATAWPLLTREAFAGFKGTANGWSQKKVLAIAIAYADSEFKRQLRDGPDAGSFMGYPGLLTPTAIRVEGIQAVQHIVRLQPQHLRDGFAERFSYWDEHLQQARELMAACQYDVDSAPAPAYVGGFRRRLRDTSKGDRSVRIDYCQHAISALLGAESKAGK
jgi:hypothetical protein